MEPIVKIVLGADQALHFHIYFVLLISPMHLTNWAPRLACLSGGSIFAFISKGGGLDFRASPHFIHLPLSRIPKTFGIQYFSNQLFSLIITYTKIILNRL